MRKMNMINLSTGSDIADEAERVRQAEEEKLKEEEVKQNQEQENQISKATEVKEETV